MAKRDREGKGSNAGRIKEQLQLQAHGFNPTGVSQRQWGNTAPTYPTQRTRKLGSSSCSSHMAWAQVVSGLNSPALRSAGGRPPGLGSPGTCSTGMVLAGDGGRAPPTPVWWGSERGTSRMIPRTTGWVVMPFGKRGFGRSSHLEAERGMMSSVSMC